MGNKKRIQLTLFLKENEAEEIERIRKEFNPEQYKLIKSHVTLCREDELGDIEKVMQILSELNHSYISIEFGPVVRFSDGKGVLISAKGVNEEFKKLRGVILKDDDENQRKHEPHITLMHPRNSACTDSLFERIKKSELPGKLEFRKISLIEQENEGKWKVLREFELKSL